MRLANDSSSFTPVHSQTRAIGPRDLHLAKGRGQDQSAFALHCSSAPACSLAKAVGEMSPRVWLQKAA